jgi:hypothetical protein
MTQVKSDESEDGLQWDQAITDHKVNTIFSETARQFFL